MEAMQYVYANPDATVNTFFALSWCSIEVSMSIISGNLPMVRIVLVWVSPPIFGSRNRSTAVSGDISAFERMNWSDATPRRRDSSYRLGQIGTTSRIEAVTKIASKSDDSGSEKGLTKEGITVGRSVDVESHNASRESLSGSN